MDIIQIGSLDDLQRVCLQWVDGLLASDQVHSLPPSPFNGLPTALQEHLSSCLCDVIWLHDLTMDGAEKEQRAPLASLLVTLHHAGLIPLSLAKERLEAELLEHAGLLESATLFTRRLVRANTHQLYRQQKYNLWREEPEGYSQLLVQLIQEPPDLKDRIIRIIGKCACF